MLCCVYLAALIPSVRALCVRGGLCVVCCFVSCCGVRVRIETVDCVVCARRLSNRSPTTEPAPPTGDWGAAPPNVRRCGLRISHYGCRGRVAEPVRTCWEMDDREARRDHGVKKDPERPKPPRAESLPFGLS